MHQFATAVPVAQDLLVSTTFKWVMPGLAIQPGEQPGSLEGSAHTLVTCSTARRLALAEDGCTTARPAPLPFVKGLKEQRSLKHMCDKNSNISIQPKSRTIPVQVVILPTPLIHPCAAQAEPRLIMCTLLVEGRVTEESEGRVTEESDKICVEAQQRDFACRTISSLPSSGSSL